MQIAELLALEGAAGGHVLGIEVDDELGAGRVRGRPRFPARRRQGEGRNGLSHGEFPHGGSPCHAAHEHELIQDFTGSRMASRLSESQKSMNSSRRCAMWMRLGTFTIICTENIGAPVCAAG